MTISTSTPYYGPDEDTATILRERSFLASDFVSGLCYGIQLVLYASCARFLWSQRHMRRFALLLLVYTTFVLCVQTIFVAVQAREVQLVYVDNRDFPGGPWAYFLSTQSLAVNVVVQATLFAPTFMCDALVLWRCWVIWHAPWQRRWVVYVVTSIPFCMLLASIATGILWTIESSYQPLNPISNPYPALPKAYGLSYSTISLSLNILLTLLTIGRVLQYRASLMSSLPTAYANHYLSLATVLIESAALYSVFAVCFLVTYVVNSGTERTFLSLAQAAQISTYLIIFRLASGKAWKTTTLARSASLSMRMYGAGEHETQVLSSAQASMHLSAPSDSPLDSASSSSITATAPEIGTELASSAAKEEKVQERERMARCTV